MNKTYRFRMSATLYLYVLEWVANEIDTSGDSHDTEVAKSVWQKLTDNHRDCCVDLTPDEAGELEYLLPDPDVVCLDSDPDPYLRTPRGLIGLVDRLHTVAFRD